MLFCREIVDEKDHPSVDEEDHPLVDEASELSFCANCVPFTCVAGNETDIQARYTSISIVLDPGPSLRQKLAPS